MLYPRGTPNVLKRILAGAVIAIMMTTGGPATELPAILSTGSLPCGDFVAAQGQSQQLFLAWALGYVTGQNSMATGAMRGAGRGWTQDSVTLSLKNYCSQHPLEPFAKAADKLRRELAAQEGLLPK